MKENKRDTSRGKLAHAITRLRKRVVAIFISCIGLVLVVSFLIIGILKAGSLIVFLQHLTEPSMIFSHFMVFLSIPTFMLIGYFYLRQQNLAENLERLVEERANRLRESQTRLKNIFAASPDAITVSDLNGKIIECNQATLDALGYSSKDEVIGRSAFEFIAKKDRERAMENLKKTLEQGSVRNTEYTYLTKDRREFHAELSASVLKDSSRNPTGFVTITKDITERKKAEETLRKSEEKYRSIVELAPDMIVTSDLRGVITSFNTAGTRISGYSKDEVVGKHFLAIGPKKWKYWRKYLNMLKSFLQGNVPEPFEVVLRHKNGNLRIVEVRGSLVKQENKPTGILAILRDITDRKRMEDELRGYSEHLEELVEERTRELKEAQERLIKSERLATIGEVATMVGHDLRNPLQAIEIATSYFNDELPRLSSSIQIPQEATKMLQLLSNSVDYADKIVKELQDFASMRKPILKKTDVKATVKETLSQVENPENIELITELGRLPWVEADACMQITSVHSSCPGSGGAVQVVSARNVTGPIVVPIPPEIG